MQLGGENHLRELTDQGADILLGIFREVGQHPHVDHTFALFRLALQDGDPGLHVGGLHVREEPSLEAGAQAIFQHLDLLGGAV